MCPTREVNPIGRGMTERNLSNVSARARAARAGARASAATAARPATATRRASDRVRRERKESAVAKKPRWRKIGPELNVVKSFPKKSYRHPIRIQTRATVNPVAAVRAVGAEVGVALPIQVKEGRESCLLLIAMNLRPVQNLEADQDPPKVVPDPKADQDLNQGVNPDQKADLDLRVGPDLRADPDLKVVLGQKAGLDLKAVLDLKVDLGLKAHRGHGPGLRAVPVQSPKAILGLDLDLKADLEAVLGLVLGLDLDLGPVPGILDPLRLNLGSLCRLVRMKLSCFKYCMCYVC